MLDYVYGHDEIIAQFVAQFIPRAQGRSFGPCATIGVVSEGALIAGIVYNNYRADAGVIEMTTAAVPGTRWLSRETLRRMYEYPFLQLGCQMIVLHADADDERLLRQLAALGHAFIRVPRLLGRDKDAVICLLTREAWESNKITKRREPVAAYEPMLEEAA